jgi:quercetin dioxygenase-like cupin family protein
LPEIIGLGAIALRFLQTGDGTDGSLDMFEMTLRPGGRMPVPHYHESWDETVYGLEGMSRWRLDDAQIELPPGESLFIKRGVVHGFDHVGGEPSRCLCVLTPGRLGPGYFREIAALVAGGPPDLAKMREVMLRHGLVPVPA